MTHIFKSRTSRLRATTMSQSWSGSHLDQPQDAEDVIEIYCPTRVDSKNAIKY